MGTDDEIAPCDVDAVGKFQRHREGRDGDGAFGVERIEGRHRASRARGQHHNFVADCESAGRQSTGLAPSAAFSRARNPLDGQAQLSGVRRGGSEFHTDSRYSSRVGPAYHGVVVERCTTLSPSVADTGMTVRSAAPRCPASMRRSDSTSRKRASSKPTGSI